tara:strand:+ start:5178 stop:5867 length:690 start_codon:yes stop_codon:yes gene_type:complete
MELKISALLSVFNDEKNVGRSIESILNQTYSNFELLIIDDGSSDDSKEVCEYYLKNDKRIKYFENSKNLGLTKSLNILLEHAKGNYIARQDSDDTSIKTRFEAQLEFIEKYNLDACTTRAKIMNSELITPNKSYYLPKKYVMKFKNPFVHGSLMINIKVLQDLGGYDERFYYAQDYALMKKFFKNDYKVKIIKNPLYNLNQTDNISTNHKEEQKYYADCVRKNKVPKLI